LKSNPSDLRKLIPKTLGERKAKLMVIFTLMTLMFLVTLGFIWAQKQVIVEVDSKVLHIKTSKNNVEELLQEAHITLDGKDEVKPGLSTILKEGMTIHVYRVKESLNTRRAIIPYRIERRLDANIPQGTVKLLKQGDNGLEEKVIKTTYIDGRVVKRDVVEEKILKEPIDKIIVVGTKKLSAPSQRRVIKTSRGDFRYRRVLNMNASAYAADPRCTGNYGNRTASGMRAGYGVVAVDRGVIPLGTRLYVEGYGHAIAADVGGAIRGNRIDLCFESYNQALRFGRRTMRVYILE